MEHHSRQQTFSVANILGKGPNDPKLDEVYKVESKQLGKGAFGVVRGATHKVKGEPVAIKSISKAKLVCKEDVKDVQAEVAIMNLVAGHPYVVTLKASTWHGSRDPRHRQCRRAHRAHGCCILRHPHQMPCGEGMNHELP